MWIFSQDRNRLIDAKDIDYDYDERPIIEKTGNTIRKRGFKVSETKVVDTVEEHWIIVNGVRVGLYSTEEKALRVLKSMFRSITYKYPSFVMPKDNEVEE
jgi:hypothetical protein